MPELPDVDLYCRALDQRFGGVVLNKVRLASPFLLRSVTPPLDAVHGKRVLGFRRIGKRVVWCLEDELFLVFHLMVTGRFHLRKPGAGFRRKLDLAAFDFTSETVMLTEAGSKKRARLHLVAGEAGLADHDPGGLELDSASLADFTERLTATNRTLKRALTDPRSFSGIGNAYSDEILHAARLSPLQRTGNLSDEEIACLFEACRRCLSNWFARLRDEVGDRFPEKVTAFRDDFAVHGRYRQPCPVCGAPVQRIVYGENEAN